MRKGGKVMEGKRKELADLSRCEERVMAEVWKAGRVSAGEIHERIHDNKWALKTVFTLICRLKKKGYLDTERCGKQALYSPAVGITEYLEKREAEYRDFCRAAGVRTE